MQPPTPFNRTSFPVPTATRRPRASASNSNLKSGGPPPTPTPRLLAAAAAVASSKTWVLHDGDTTSGVGMLVLAMLGGRIWREVMERRGDRKGKRKEMGGAEVLSLTQVGSAVALCGQAVAFFLAVSRIGPLRGSFIAITSSLLGPLWQDDNKGHRQPIPYMPALVACAFVLFDAHKLHGPECLINLFTLIALTLFLCGPWATSLEVRNRSSKSGSNGRLGRLILTCGVSVVLLLSLIYLNILPRPHLLSHIKIYQIVLPLATACLAAYAPLPFSQTYDPKPASKFRRPRDYLIYLFSIVILQFFALHPIPTTIDVLVLLPLVLSTIYLRPSPSDTPIPKSTPAKDWRFTPSPMVMTESNWSYWNLIPRSWKPHFQTILNTDSSRKILYFLLINLGYMGVQMGYGVMTNSLGLISDAIHMFFDCLGIGIGLWASVAATWKPDGRYTFGYSRVETLSGFTNGLFLILISIFIIFEAIQRIMDPPEMEMRQLLLVSSIGLGINLFGMWATGGHHHHHGHSHGGHGHDHGRSHAHVHHKKEDHMHDHIHDQNHDSHSHHDHSTTSSLSGTAPLLNRRRSSAMETNELNLTSHGKQNHDHDHYDHDDHSHSHAHEKKHDCNHNHSSHEKHDHHAHDHHDVRARSHSHSAHEHEHDHDLDHKSGHSHSHQGHAHSHNMRGVFLHVMADTLGSVGVIISTLLIRYTGLTIFDPIASLFIAALIMASVIPLVIDSGRVLCLDVGADCETEIQTALADLVGVEGLANYSAPRFWPRCEGELVGSIHIQLAPSRSSFDPSKFSNSPAIHKGPAIYANADKVVSRVEKILRSKIPGLTEMIIQVEGSEERVFCDCMTGG